MHFETTSESEDFFQVAANSFSRNWLIFVIIFFLLIENSLGYVKLHFSCY